MGSGDRELRMIEGPSAPWVQGNLYRSVDWTPRASGCLSKLRMQHVVKPVMGSRIEGCKRQQALRGLTISISRTSETLGHRPSESTQVLPRQQGLGMPGNGSL
jgi:hypothetical protein